MSDNNLPEGVAELMQTPGFKNGEPATIARYEQLYQKKYGFDEIQPAGEKGADKLSPELEALKQKYQGKAGDEKGTDPNQRVDDGQPDPEHEKAVGDFLAKYGDQADAKFESGRIATQFVSQHAPDLMHEIMSSELGNHPAIFEAAVVLGEFLKSKQGR